MLAQYIRSAVWQIAAFNVDRFFEIIYPRNNLPWTAPDPNIWWETYFMYRNDKSYCCATFQKINWIFKSIEIGSYIFCPIIPICLILKLKLITHYKMAFFHFHRCIILSELHIFQPKQSFPSLCMKTPFLIYLLLEDTPLEASSNTRIFEKEKKWSRYFLEGGGAGLPSPPPNSYKPSQDLWEATHCKEEPFRFSG